MESIDTVRESDNCGRCTGLPFELGTGTCNKLSTCADLDAAFLKCDRIVVLVNALENELCTDYLVIEDIALVDLDFGGCRCGSSGSSGRSRGRCSSCVVDHYNIVRLSGNFVHAYKLAALNGEYHIGSLFVTGRSGFLVEGIDTVRESDNCGRCTGLPFELGTGT